MRLSAPTACPTSLCVSIPVPGCLGNSTVSDVPCNERLMPVSSPHQGLPGRDGVPGQAGEPGKSVSTSEGWGVSEDVS